MNSTQKRFLIFCLTTAVIIISIGALLSYSLASSSAAVNPQAKSKNLQAADKGVTMDERLGVDDNAALAIFYGGDMQGSLADCGCRLHPQGGLARRVSYVSAFKDKFKDKIPSLHIDVGHIFNDEADISHPDILQQDSITMNDWIRKGFSQFKLDAVNISFRDLPYSAMVMAKDKYASYAKETSMVEDLISANVIPATDLNKTIAPKPYVIREVEGSRFGNKKSIKVGFIGLTEAGPGGQSGLVIADPLNRLKQILPEVRAKADIVVLLGYLPLATSKQIAHDNVGIDIIIAANATPIPPIAQREGDTVIVYSVNQTKSLGELHLFLDQNGHIKDYLNRYISLDKVIPDNPQAAQLNDQAKAAVDAVKAQLYKDREATQKPAAGAPIMQTAK